MTDDELLRYSRHILLDDIGIEGQQRLRNGRPRHRRRRPGSPVAPVPRQRGHRPADAGRPDIVDLTNLQRQIAHTHGRIGAAKVASARAAVLAMDPALDVVVHERRADAATLRDLGRRGRGRPRLQRQLRHAPGHQCGLRRGRRAARRRRGTASTAQVSVYDTRRADCPCYACLFPPDAAPPEVRCATMGVFAPLVGIIGSLQAAEALKLVAGVGLRLPAGCRCWTRARCAGRRSACRAIPPAPSAAIAQRAARSAPGHAPTQRLRPIK
jgi:molybdopterin/thiamine biosynthesis adenylyltransferase